MKLSDAEAEKVKFHCSNKKINISAVNKNKIITSDELPCSKNDYKYFFGYKNKKEISLFVLLPKMSGYLKNF